MALVPIRIYKKSFLASFFSILGTILLAVGIALLFEEAGPGVICIVIGLVLFLLIAPAISKQKLFKLWVKDLKSKGFVAQMPTNNELCFQIYKANPEKMTLNFIEKHNPEAAKMLRSTLQKTK